MIPIRLSELAALLDCDAPVKDVEITDVVSDSRQSGPGALFAALAGERFDGHDFCASAVGLGAEALLVSRPVEADVPQLVVDDVLRALGEIARRLREKNDLSVVGITGSNGKTTVKEMVAAILRRNGPVLSTGGNFNNELGLPLTLFRLNPEHRYAVLEMGAGKPGDIEYLARIARPDVGLVNNISPAHLEGFGSLEGVALTKGAMFAELPADGWAVMNADEPWLETWREMSSAGNTITFGVSEEADVRLVESEDGPRIFTPVGDYTPQLALPGRHNLLNAAAATAIALALDIEMDMIRQGLERVEPVPGRLNLMHTAAGWTVIDDTYNANPASLYSALQVLSGIPGEPWLVLGDMKELGTGSYKMHREVGESAKTMGVKRLFATGELTVHTVDAFGPGAEHYETREELVRALRRRVRPGVNLLIKGSRSMGMELVVQAVMKESALREAS
ncbi:MAG: UDP-N-acetylmuramoyl-tripeptide--D-alanyl-D-alanine ligase [Gammaproteobacteria bacterium]|nr:UDP-N-acetylmuramoyl-tripeptide--D-alanyl-D-alanine ligase [Gammaproteobacteria bacterium]